MLTDTHFFNERLKRLEPKATKCEFCSFGNSTAMNDNYFVPIFKVRESTNIIIFSSVKYSKILIGIPRCISCRGIHSEAVKKSNLIAAICGISTILLGFLFFGPKGFFGIPVGLLIGFCCSYFLSKKFIADRGVTTLKSGAQQNCTVQAFITGGWSFTEPSA
jgi:hypothetical protein